MNSRGSKKDLTSIEDLGEFVHEPEEMDLLQEDSLESDSPAELPDLPASDELQSFGTEGLEFGGGDDLPASDFSDDASPFDQSDPFSESSGALNASEDKVSETSAEDDNAPWDQASALEASTPLEEEVQDLSFTEEPQDPTTPTTAPLNKEPSLPFSELSSLSKTEIPTVHSGQAEAQYQAPETFSDLRTFSESSNFSGAAVEGNPSFSVLVKKVRYLEDIEDILTLLRELKLLTDPEEQVKARLMRGTLLIPRVSEFVAVFLAHKLRRFDLDLLVGPSEEIHPSKHHETPETGIVSRHSLYQNQSHSFHFDDARLELTQIIVAATPSLDGHQVVKYLGVASEHKILDGQMVEDEGSSEVPLLYQELAQKLRAHALKARANAVVGLNYQLTPIPTEFGARGNRYRLTCTGNLVWVNKL